MNKTNLENQLLVEQTTNLAVLNLIPPAYSNIIPDLNNTETACSVATPYISYSSWATTEIDDINNNIIPAYNAAINEMVTVDMVNTVNMINLVNTAITSNGNFQNEVDGWLIVYQTVNGDANNQLLIDATTQMNTALAKAILDTQNAILAINGAVSSTDLAGLYQEVLSLNQTIVLMAINVEIERGNSAFPDPGTLYAELETVDSIQSDAQSKTTTCLAWTAQQQQQQQQP